MHKNDLKALVDQIYENLIERIETNDTDSKEQILGYLKDAIEVISDLDMDKLDSIERAREAFKHSYKDLAKQSLSSYKYTSEKFQELNQLHEKALQECSTEHINLEDITNKFSEIQTHMTEEIKRANQVISDLTHKVQELEQTSNLDPLTKVFNRRALNSYLSNVFANKHTDYSFHLLMLDIDNFKKLNDSYGHITGDKILIFIASLLRKALRDGDKIFRYGGEEFTIILDRNSDEQAFNIATRLVKLIKANNLIYLGEQIVVTASVGMTKLLSTDTSPEDILSRADKALYISKSNGKNMASRICE